MAAALVSRRRLFSTLSSESNRLSSESNPPNWPPKAYSSIEPGNPWNIDIGRWSFIVNRHLLKCKSEKDFYSSLTKAVGESIGSEAEARNRIYFVSVPHAFGGYFDKETRDKITKDLGFIRDSKPDIYYEARMKHPTTVPQGMAFIVPYVADKKVVH